MMTTTRSTSLALTALLAACGGGGSAAPAPAAPQPTTNAAGRPATREALADIIYGAFANNRPADLDVLLPTNTEIAGCTPDGSAPTMAEHEENLTRWRAAITDTIAECHKEIVWAGATRAGLWGGHPAPPPAMCTGMTGHFSLDIDIQTTKGLVTLRVETPQQLAGGFLFTGAECGTRDGDERHLATLGRPPIEKEFEAYTNEICACKDMKCITDAGGRFAERHKNDKPRDYNAKPSKKMVDLTMKMADCNKKIMEEEMKKAMPPGGWGDEPPAGDKPAAPDDEDY